MRATTRDYDRSLALAKTGYRFRLFLTEAVNLPTPWQTVRRSHILRNR